LYGADSADREAGLSSWKLETDVGPAGLPQFLRALAHALESGAGAGELAGLPRLDDARGLRKLVLVAAPRSEGFQLTLKAKRDHEVRVPASMALAARPSPAAGSRARAADDAARLREKYRQLKKAMQTDYKTLRKAAEAGLMPAQDALESFLALSESMAEMPQPLTGAGQEAGELARANAAFLVDARALRQAMRSRDAAALLEVLSRLERRKAACHAQFC